MNKSPHRRKFLKTATIAAAGSIIPTPPLSAASTTTMPCSTISPTAASNLSDANDPETELPGPHPQRCGRQRKRRRSPRQRRGYRASASPPLHRCGARRITRDRAEDRTRPRLGSCIPDSYPTTRLVLPLPRHPPRATFERHRDVNQRLRLAPRRRAHLPRLFREDHEIADLATLLYSRYDFR